MWSFQLLPQLLFKLATPLKYNKEYIFNINIFNILSLFINKSYERDHAGFLIDLNVFGLNIMYNNYDIRHWDEDNDCWCVYEN